MKTTYKMNQNQFKPSHDVESYQQFYMNPDTPAQNPKRTPLEKE
jgi:hypothetical protein